MSADKRKVTTYIRSRGAVGIIKRQSSCVGFFEVRMGLFHDSIRSHVYYCTCTNVSVLVSASTLKICLPWCRLGNRGLALVSTGMIM
jgi:hypothetical protein